jgi:predicted DNA-binding transcriptional regulator AlpA
MPATPLFVRERKAAQLLDLKLNEFLRLVECGALPKPVKIGGEHKRWFVRDLEAIRTGAAMDGQFEW